MSPSVVAECRPNLRACHFFIKNVPDARDCCVMEQEDQSITVRMPHAQLRVILPPSIHLVPGSVTGHTCTEESIVFRCRIEEFTFGDTADNALVKSTPTVRQNEPVTLKCDLCGGFIVDSLSFSRVLPLPSSEEPSDFFCHRHSDKPVSLDPGPYDLFYNFFFYKVNANNFRSFPTTGPFKCPQCFELLGETRGNCVKLWKSVVSFSFDKQMSAVEKLLESFKLFLKNLPVQMNKFVFVSSRETCTHYTLVWIMDRTLTLLESQQVADSNPGIFSELCLEPKKVMKVLYSHEEEMTETVDEWMKSFSTSTVPIHPRVDELLLNYLKTRAECIPVDSSSINDMSISFIDYN